MPIIDAHLHLFAPSPQTAAMAGAVGHECTADYLSGYYAAHDIAMGIVYFTLAFFLAFGLFAATFHSAIDRRRQLERELEE